MPLDKSTEIIVADWDPSELISPSEEYPVIGELAEFFMRVEVQRRLVGFQRYAQCFEKSLLVQQMLILSTWVVFGDYEFMTKTRCLPMGLISTLHWSFMRGSKFSPIPS